MRRGLAQLVQEERQPGPVIEAATSWPTRSMKKPAAASGMRKRRPLASWPDMKSIDQRSFGRVGMAIRTRGRLARTCRPSREWTRRLRLRFTTKPSRLSMWCSVR